MTSSFLKQSGAIVEDQKIFKRWQICYTRTLLARQKATPFDLPTGEGAPSGGCGVGVVLGGAPHDFTK